MLIIVYFRAKPVNSSSAWLVMANLLPQLHLSAVAWGSTFCLTSTSRQLSASARPSTLPTSVVPTVTEHTITLSNRNHSVGRQAGSFAWNPGTKYDCPDRKITRRPIENIIVVRKDIKVRSTPPQRIPNDLISRTGDETLGRLKR